MHFPFCYNFNGDDDEGLSRLDVTRGREGRGIKMRDK